MRRGPKQLARLLLATALVGSAVAAGPRVARADDPGAGPRHPYGSIDRPAVGEPGSADRRGGDARAAGTERLRGFLESLPPAERRRVARRLRSMSPEQRQQFFAGFQGLSPAERRARFRHWMEQGGGAVGRDRRQHELREQELRDRRDDLDGLDEEKGDMRRTIQQVPPGRRPALRERMKDLDPAEQREIARRIGRWRRLDEREKAEVRERLERYRDHSEAWRDSLREKADRWQQKTPAERDALRRQWQRWQSLTPAEREALRRDLGANR